MGNVSKVLKGINPNIDWSVAQPERRNDVQTCPNCGRTQGVTVEMFPKRAAFWKCINAQCQQTNRYAASLSAVND
jgi:ssDNA-binding Zn-finger/Zn-ribbon topoisomerase 1